MQKMTFTDGGYVLHKIDGKTSAWFDRDGNLLDAETYDRLGRRRDFKYNGPAWLRLQSIGRVYREGK